MENLSLEYMARLEYMHQDRYSASRHLELGLWGLCTVFLLNQTSTRRTKLCPGPKVHRPIECLQTLLCKAGLPRRELWEDGACATIFKRFNSLGQVGMVRGFLTASVTASETEMQVEVLQHGPMFFNKAPTKN